MAYRVRLLLTLWLTRQRERWTRQGPAAAVTFAAGLLFAYWIAGRLLDPFLRRRTPSEAAADVAALGVLYALLVTALTLGAEDAADAPLDRLAEACQGAPVTLGEALVALIIAGCAAPGVWLLVFPATLRLAERGGWGWSAPPLAILSALAFAAAVAALRWLLEYAGHVRLSRRAHQTAALVAAGVGVGGLLAATLRLTADPEGLRRIVAPLAAVGPYWPVGALASGLAAGDWRALTFGWTSCGATAALVVAGLWSALRLTPLTARETPLGGIRRWSPPVEMAAAAKPMQLLPPALALGGLIWLAVNQDARRLLAESPKWGGFLCLLFGVTVIAWNVPRLIVVEGQGFLAWFDYPRSPLRHVFRLAALWTLVALLLSLAAWGVALSERGRHSEGDALILAAMVIGLPLCGAVCASAAILGTTPPAPDAPPALRLPTVAFAVAHSLALPFLALLPTRWAIVGLALFSYLTLGWWLLADERADAFLDAASDEGEAARLGFWRRLGSMFWSPGEVFADIARRSKCLLPVVAASGLALMGAYAVERALPYSAIEIEQARAEARAARRPASPPAQARSRESASFDVWLRRAGQLVYAVVGLPLLLVVAAGFGLTTGVAFWGWRLTFGQSLAVVAYTWLPVEAARLCAVMAAVTLAPPPMEAAMQADWLPAASLAVWLPEATPAFLGEIARLADAFNIGWLAWSAIGLRAVAKERG